jgi:hypothetical protein
MADVGFFLGALLGVGAVTLIAHGIVKRWLSGLKGILAANALSLAFATIVSGYGLADGGPPIFFVGFLTYVLPQLIVLALMTWRFKRKQNASAVL